MNKIYYLLIFFSFFANAQSLITPYEKGNGNQTTNYKEMLAFYDSLDQQFETLKIFEKGTDDNGEPIRIVVFDPEKKFDFNNPRKSVLLINNGIHPGEPDGIDASMMMLRNFAEGKYKAPKNVIIASIEAYNISGMLNRGKYSRANQNGPEEYGFRGNARNFDLNRDFIKTDSKNAKAFQEIFQWTKPDYFIDNHVSNGADYPYVFTYISSNKERLGKPLGAFLTDEMQEEILKGLDKKNILHVPYVNVFGASPDKGFSAFMDTPRYTTGYTALFNVPGTVAETHMLKPYPQRVEATLEYMLSSIDYLDNHFEKVKKLRKESFKEWKAGAKYPIEWKLDSTVVWPIAFKGYEAGFKPSAISGKPRLYYDRTRPYEKKINYYCTYKPERFVTIPKYYAIPQSEWKVIENLKRNGIEVQKINSDSLVSVQVYRISDFQTVNSPYEGHYLHYNTVVTQETEKANLREGDFLVSTDQPGIKYLLETLEPEAVDSFFNWNFFDGILGQKEHYSPYVFEDTAEKLLQENPALKTAFEMEKSVNKDFAEDGKAQLEWIYRNSPYFEKTFRKYPIYRIL